VSEALKTIRHAIDTWNETKPKKFNFRTRLQKATKDQYQRTGSKESRFQAKKKDKPCTGKPKLVTATAQQKAKYRSLLRAA
jgi:hypothetical protein